MLNALASISAAPLPVTYETAKNALAECQAIDECKDWADKAAALASYARQSEDLELEKMAARIRARAMRRAGELLKQIEPATGKNNQYQQVKSDGVDSFQSRTEVAQRAGMSERQQVTAVRVASIPERQFTEQVESANPPTLTELARQGTQKREAPPDPETWLKGRSPGAFNKALHFIALLERYAKELSGWNVGDVIECLTDDERRAVRNCIARIDAAHDKIITRI